MFKPLSLAFFAAALTVPTLAPAQDFARRQNFNLPVIAVGPNSFEVIEADGAGGTQIWCAAGIYARHVLGQRNGDLTVVEGRGPSKSRPGRKGVVFTTDKNAEGSPSLTRSIRKAGSSFSIAHTFALCSQYPRLRIETETGRRVRRTG